MTINIPTRVEPVLPEEREQAERQVREARASLTELLGTSPRWLHSAASFVARVTPRQLRAIASYPMTKAIWLNRELRTLYHPA